MSANQPIGIFDSGIGGLTVARAVKDVLPDATLIYFGDTVHYIGVDDNDVIKEPNEGEYYNLSITGSQIIPI